MESLTGQLLISAPQLPDENFFRAVVLVLKHTEDGALGLILNRPTHITLREVWPEITGRETDIDSYLHFGGPVEGPLMALHTSFSVAEDGVLPGVFYSIRQSQLNALVGDKKLPLIIYTGHSGWGPGQLENEIAAGGWLVSPAKYEHIFEAQDDLWKSVCEQIGQEILISSKYRSHVPDDPSLN